MNKFNNYFGTKCRVSSIVWSAALVSMILTLIQSPTFAAPPLDQAAHSRAVLRIYYAWLNAPWTEDDSPYQRIRTNIEQAISQGASPFDLLKQREKELDKSPGDFQAQFAYYYTAYQAATWPKRPSNTEFSIGVQILGNLFIAIIRVPHPRTYNYARLEFLCGQYNFEDPNRKAIGIRLVSRDPNDYDVKYYTTSLLISSPLPSDQVIALKYANSLVTNYPDKASLHSMAAYIHYQLWHRTKNKQDAAEAISQYQQYLRLAPSKEGFRKQAEKFINEMQQG